MAIVYLESGTDATGDFAFFSSTSGTVASDNTVSKTGPRSIKLSTVAGPTTAFALTPAATAANSGTRVTFWFRFDALPAANSQFFYVLTNGSSVVFSIVLTPGGLLRIGPIGVSAVNGTTVMAINTWYRISFAYTITNATTYQIDGYVNGVREITIVNSGTMTTTATDRCRVNIQSTWGTGANCWFDDICIDNGSDYTDPGDIRVTAKRPAANSTNNFDTNIGANPANRWTNVNEVALSTTNGWQHAATTDVQENYTLETKAAGDVNIETANVVGRRAWIWARAATGSAGTPKIMDNGTETAIVLTTTAALYTVITTSSDYPSNAAGIGMRATNNAADTFLYECGTLIAYKARRRAHAT